ncbi:ABC-type sulfate transport system, periplasmic component [Serpentinimonas raichei]|uniref:ABC-type sulfate transport system, periplasmic component n=1 Tax=Serpentinimonas raichei TaxID=1458425 RepID=A0A060NSZ1_9BURK|nr:sulfate ABC transporter substrate-binding protein [Serpentinimonas raichei]BAO82024.1 ABC-type sulfate transport system, periplasmic component [Serpentinimonas raichei]
MKPSLRGLLAVFALLTLLFSPWALAQGTLLNVSFDVSREFYREINAAFVAQQQQRGAPELRIDMSHAGSSAQARSVADGLHADVVSMNTVTDIEFLASRGVVAADWRQRFPHQAVPTTSTMLFLVRQGNPKNIRDWSDLVRPGVQVVVVNPKTGGNGRMAYLAAWGYVRSKGGSDADAAAFVRQLYRNVPVLARGGRDATGVFLQRNIGDVLVTFESEVISVEREFGVGHVDVVHPSVSLLTENPVALVERTVNQRGSRELATAYLNFLYSEQGQEIAARHHFRPRNPEVLRRHAQTLRPIRLFTVEQYFGSWAEAQRVHFNDGGTFDQIFEARR